MQPGDTRSIRGYVSGRVQGVGFRYFVQRVAHAEGLAGQVRNLADGRVEFYLQGPAAAVERALARIRRGPDYSRVSDMHIEPVDWADDMIEFVIRR